MSSSRTDSAGRPRRAGGTRDAGRTRIAIGSVVGEEEQRRTRHTLSSGCARRADDSICAGDARWTLLSVFAVDEERRTDRTLRAGSAGGTDRTLSSLRSGWAGRPVLADLSVVAADARWTRGPGRARRTARPRRPDRSAAATARRQEPAAVDEAGHDYVAFTPTGGTFGRSASGFAR